MICHRLLTLSIFLILLAPSISAAQTNSPPVASIQGSVVDTRTSQPIPGATVTAHGQQASRGWSSATTGPDGTFLLPGLPPGRYRLAASRNGYVDSSGRHGMHSGDQTGGTSFSLSAGQTLDGVTLRLTPTGVISGHITDQRDEPMPGVLVQTMLASYHTGHREFSDARTGFTDDRGEFRIWGLAPGRYYLKATNPRNGDQRPTSAQVYVPTFYPGVYDAAQSQPIELHGGEELTGINLNLSPLRAVHVKGRVLIYTGQPAKAAQVTLCQSSGTGFVVEAQADSSGRFDISGVPSGSYVLDAQFSEDPESTHALMGHSNISVAEANVDAPDITIFPGATMTGHLRADGDRKITLGRASASLRPLSNTGTDSYGETVPIQPDGSFTFRDIPEGEYRILVAPLPDGYYMKHDPADANVVVSHGRAAPVEVRLASGAGRIQGIAYRDNDHQQVASSVTIALVPDATRRSDTDSYRFSVTGQSGQFALNSIPPGDYVLFAFENVDRDAFMDPDFLARNESSGKPVHVEDAANLDLQIQLAIEADSR